MKYYENAMKPSLLMTQKNSKINSSGKSSFSARNSPLEKAMQNVASQEEVSHHRASCNHREGFELHLPLG